VNKTAKELIKGDRVEDGGRSGRIVKSALSLGQKVRVTWVDGWSETIDADTTLEVRDNIADKIFK
jgi:hypothetical protein